MTKITFEDHGQDFLTWTIDEKGKIIECKPFQFSIWSQWTVTNLRWLKVGGFVKIKKGRQLLTIKYPIQDIEILKP